jgi:hypothetical protein
MCVSGELSDIALLSKIPSATPKGLYVLQGSITTVLPSVSINVSDASSHGASVAVTTKWATKKGHECLKIDERRYFSI